MYRKPNPESYNSLPNQISLSRIAITPAVCAALLYDWHTVAALGIAWGTISDWLDGWVARKMGAESTLGTKLDPLADKVFIAGVSGTLLWLGALPGSVVGTILLRDVVLINGYFVYQWFNTAKENRSIANIVASGSHVNVVPSFLSKLNTVFQCLLLVVALLTLWYPEDENLKLTRDWLGYLVIVLTVVSGLHYGVTMQGVKVTAR